MAEIIDLSQEIYSSMPVYKGLPSVKIEMHASHEEWAGEANPSTATPAVNRLDMGEHTGTHVDAISHMGKAYAAQSIETPPVFVWIFHINNLRSSLRLGKSKKPVSPLAWKSEKEIPSCFIPTTIAMPSERPIG